MQLKKNLFTKLAQRGDTIIEVTIAIAVCGLVLGGSFYAINHESLEIENQQEHNQAIKLVESQLEDLRTYYIEGNTVNTNLICLYTKTVSGTLAIVEDTTSGQPQGSNPCILQGDGSLAPAGAEPAYSLSINLISSGSSTTFSASVSWLNVYGTNSEVSLDFRPQ
jgi:type II secretory pathway pseudopilin PulG